MTSKFGLYEVFAYTIPGGFYLLTIVYVLSVYQIVIFDYSIIDTYSSWLIILSIMISYSLGLLLDPLAAFVHYRLSKKPTREDIIMRFKEKHPDIKFNFSLAYTPVLRAYVKHSNSELGNRIERAGATKALFRNFGLNFFVFAVLILLQLITPTHYSIPIIFAPVFGVLSFLALIEYKKWHRWYFQMTYESMIAISLDKLKLVGVNEIDAKEL